MKLGSEKEKIAHLLRRFALGASEMEMEYYSKGGLKEAINKLLNYESVENPLPDIEPFFRADNNNLRPQAVKAWWMLHIMKTRRPLEEKMTIFWHDHFATSFSKVSSGELMKQQNEIIRENATGGFKVLLSTVSKDPAMLFWLDGQLNVKGKPNENFAREIMELFTLGVDNYTEKDVQEAARAFTGWQINRPQNQKGNVPRRAEFIFRPRLHDTGEKTILGKTGNFTGDDVIDLLCEQVQTARYITQKIWEWFVYPKPSAATIDKYASIFRKSNLNIKTLLRAIMESDEFYSDKAVHALYKNPIDFCAPTLRQLGLGEEALAQEAKVPIPRRASLTAFITSTKAMGMELMAPPDVAGWEGGQGWISSATMVERIKWADRLFGAPIPGRGGNLFIRVRAFDLFDNGTPSHVVDRLASIFDVQLPDEKKKKIIAAATEVSGGQITPENANKVAQAASRMIFGSPEFQFF